VNRPDKLTFVVGGMGCPGCVSVIENAVMPIPGVAYVGVSLASGTMTLRPGPGLDVDQVLSIVDALGYRVGVPDGTAPPVGTSCPCLRF